MRVLRFAVPAALIIAVALGAVAYSAFHDAAETGRVDGPGAGLDESRHTVAGTEIARGDFETGDLRQWDGVQRVAADRVEVVRDPTDQGNFAGRFEVRDGDNPIGYGDRAEVQLGTDEAEGEERWYAWSTLFDRTYPNSDNWQVVTQWHSQADGSPPVAFQVLGEDVALVTNPHDADAQPSGPPIVHWKGPLDRGTWHHFRLRVTWSGDDATGTLQLWHNGRRVTGRIHARTLYPGYGAYVKQGLYRQSGESQTGIVYHDGFRVSEVASVQ